MTKEARERARQSHLDSQKSYRARRALRDLCGWDGCKLVVLEGYYCPGHKARFMALREARQARRRQRRAA